MCAAQTTMAGDEHRAAAISPDDIKIDYIKSVISKVNVADLVHIVH
jgi:hypothetical protein